jgi:hypothetical protein
MHHSHQFANSVRLAVYFRCEGWRWLETTAGRDIFPDQCIFVIFSEFF